jgi:hypothetical protein
MWCGDAVGGDFYVPRLGHAHQDRGSGPPGGFWNAASLGACHLERVSVNMQGMMVHAQVDKANPDAVALADNQRSGCRTRFAVEQEPVVFHVHGVGHGVVG